MANLDLPVNMSRAAAGFVDELKRVYKDELVSVVLYGSALTGAFRKKYSDLNILVVLGDTRLGNLSRIKRTLMRNRYRLVNALFFTEEYINASVDVFPIEFLDMKEKYMVLYGKDVLSGLKIDTGNLRFQVEQELKALLVKARRFYMANGDKGVLRRGLARFFTSFTCLGKNLVRLKGKPAPLPGKDVLRCISENFGTNVSALLEIAEARDRNAMLKSRDVERLFTGFVSELEKITVIVDGVLPGR